MIRELEDRWILGLREGIVDSVVRGPELVLALDTGAEIRVSAGALITLGPVTAPDAEVTRISELTDDQLLGLVGARVLSAVAFKSGSLRVVFSTRHHLNSRAADTAAAQVLYPGKFEWSYQDGNVRMKIHDRDC